MQSRRRRRQNRNRIILIGLCALLIIAVILIIVLTANPVKNDKEAESVEPSATPSQIVLPTPTPTPAPTLPPEPTQTATPEPTQDDEWDSENATVLKLGDTSDDVKKMQEKLIELGYDVSKATGYFGTETEAAVKAFQKKNDLEDDGIAGKGTLSKLYSGDAVAAS